MIQGTTPTHVFQLSIDTGIIQQLRITYTQCGKPVIEATEADVDMDGQEIRYRLTQEDTLKFDPKAHAELQLKVRISDGNVLASRVMKIPVDRILNTEVLK